MVVCLDMVEFDAFNDPVIASFQGQAEPYDEGDSWLGMMCLC